MNRALRMVRKLDPKINVNQALEDTAEATMAG
jgi:hypothetical protein